MQNIYINFKGEYSLKIKGVTKTIKYIGDTIELMVDTFRSGVFSARKYKLADIEDIAGHPIYDCFEESRIEAANYHNVHPGFLRKTMNKGLYVWEVRKNNEAVH